MSAETESKKAKAARANRIATLNDDFRAHLFSHPPHGLVLITSGVQDLGHDAVMAIAVMVRNFNDFSAENDPYHEHDFGKIMWGETRIFFKIDYYAKGSRDYGSDAPEDAAQTDRVLTLMLASEY